MSGKDGSAVPPPPGLFGIGGNNQGGWGQPNQGQWGQQQGGNTSGDIVIRPIEGSFLEDLDTFTKMDPFCEIRYGQSLQKSKVCEQGGKFPKWTDVLTFQRTNDTFMNIKVQDEDIISNDLIGDGVLNLSHAFSVPGTAHTEIINLAKLGKTTGTVRFTVEYRPQTGANTGW